MLSRVSVVNIVRDNRMLKFLTRLVSVRRARCCASLRKHLTFGQTVPCIQYVSLDCARFLSTVTVSTGYFYARVSAAAIVLHIDWMNKDRRIFQPETLVRFAVNFESLKFSSWKISRRLVWKVI